MDLPRLSRAILLAVALLAFPVTAYSPQHPFLAPSAPLDPELGVEQFHAASESAGRYPNIKTRLETTSQEDAGLFCGKDGDKYKSGYAHFTNVNGDEDKHLFWWCVVQSTRPKAANVHTEVRCVGSLRRETIPRTHPLFWYLEEGQGHLEFLPHFWAKGSCIYRCLETALKCLELLARALSWVEKTMASNPLLSLLL
jgi:hypothetical protein